MHAYQSLHPSLADLLRFEEQRLGIPIEVVRKPLYSLAPSPPFRPVIDIRMHSSTAPETFPVLLADELLEVTSPAQTSVEVREVGFKDRTGQFCPLAGVTDNRVTVFFDLNELFYSGNVRRKPTNGAISGHPGNKVADLIFSQALTIAQRNIRKYDWKREVREYTSHVVASHRQTLETWRGAYRQNERDIEEKSWEIQKLARKNGELRQRIRTHNLLTVKRVERKAREDHQNLVRLLGRGVTSFRVTSGVLTVTTAPVEIAWGGTTYDMGRYVISVPLSEGRLTVKPADDNDVEGYPHPHVASDGAPCLGNMGATVAQLLGEGEHFQLVTTLLEFLRSYNPDNPYLRLEKWDPDWEDEDNRYESCYDDAALSECATCSDWDCPHRDGAEGRCYEYTNTEDCIACGGCERAQDAVRYCRGQHAPEECFACDAECEYAGDADACLSVHNGDHCPDCPNDNCNHHPEGEDNETDR